MTTSPVVTVTDELIAELEAAACESIYGCPTWLERDGYSLGSVDDSDRNHIVTASPATIIALLAERAELKRDAERYRHASKHESDGDVDICICKVVWNSSGTADYVVLTGDNAHTAIDSAMQSAQ